MLEGVCIEAKKVIPHEKGNVLHMLRSDDSMFKAFGEVYFSFCLPGCIKGWKKHTRQTQHFAVPLGNLKLVIFDDREGSSTFQKVQTIFFGEDDHKLVRIPSGIWYSFSPTCEGTALIVNCTDIPHEPKEAVTKDLNDPSIPYQWKG